jgi:hypothetical protein
MNAYGRISREGSVGEGKERTLMSEEDKVCYILLVDNETHKTLFGSGGREKKDGRYNGGGEPVQSTLMHVWNYHKEIFILLMYANSKIK